MYTLSAAAAEERAFAPLVAQVGVPGEVRPRQSILSRLAGWCRSKLPRRSGPVWRRLASLPLGSAASGQSPLDAPCAYRFLKLRATSVDVQIRRLMLDFVDGSIQDLSIGWLLRGCESPPICIARRELKGIIVEYHTAARVRTRVEVWAHA
jgi:hypothetical protein